VAAGRLSTTNPINKSRYYTQQNYVRLHESLDEISRRRFYVMTLQSALVIVHEFNEYMNQVLRVSNPVKMHKGSSEVSPSKQERPK
jgi:hypothetical protein